MALPEGPPHTPVSTPEARAHRAEMTFVELKKCGMLVGEDVQNNLVNAVRMKSVPITYLHKLSDAGDAFAELRKSYMGKTIGVLGLKSIPYLSSRDAKNISRATSINSLKELELHSKLLPLYLKKVELINMHFIHGAYVENLKWEVKGIPGVSEINPLTATEMKKVHKMSLKKGNRWLNANDHRILELHKATYDFVVTDKKTFDKLRSMDPAKARIEIKKMTVAHKKRNEAAQRKKDAKKLKELEAELS